MLAAVVLPNTKDTMVQFDLGAIWLSMEKNLMVSLGVTANNGTVFC